ncbi:MAG: glutathione S-transferase family protein, partial [Pseudomonadota bacterium]
PPVISAFAEGEVALHLGYMRDSLGDQAFILGDTLQAPDIGFTYICQMAERLGELNPYPTLKAYLDRNLERPAFKRAMERTGG